jgi:predicted SAM-dependent methyltransferase
MMNRIQFGCGGNHIDRWENYDSEVDISKPLPREDNTYNYVFSEHVVEHLDPPRALNFFMECHRILVPGGVFRVAVPSVAKIYRDADEEYLKWVEEMGYGEPTKEGAIKSIILNHYHLSAWTAELLDLFLFAAGFKIRVQQEVGKSSHPELTNIEGHADIIGEHNNLIETIVFEATK